MIDLINKLQWRHLRLIEAVGKFGQITLAAEHMGITQPAASRMLSDIESMIEQPLFERKPTGLSPYPLGAILISHASDLLQGLQNAVSEVKAFDAGMSGKVIIGAVTGAAVAYVVPAVQALKREVKDADVHVDVAPSDELVRGLINGDYDFVLARVPSNRDPRVLDVLHGKVESVNFMVRDGHPILALPEHSLVDLAGLNWVVQAPGTPMRQAVQEAFIERGIMLPREIVNTSSLLFMIAYLQSSDFITPVSSEVATLFKSVTASGLKTIKTQESIIISPYHLIRRKNFKPIPVAKRFECILKQILFSP